MKALFMPGPSPSTVFVMAGLARALQLGGHGVLVAANDEAAELAADIGLPAVSVTSMASDHAARRRQDGSSGGPADGQVDSAAAEREALRELIRSWRPDVIVGAPLVIAAPGLAAEFGLPFVRHAWDTGEPDTVALDVADARIPWPDLDVEIAPPSLLPDPKPGAQFMRWMPGNRQSALEPWMYVRGERRRVCVTAGSRSAEDDGFRYVRRLVTAASASNVEIVIAAPEFLAARLREVLPGVLAGWIPLDVVASTCALVVHPAGGVTTMTAVRAGVPQLIAPMWDVPLATASLVCDFGAGAMVVPDSTDAVAAACEAMLSDRSYAQSACVLAREMAALPTPSDVVGVLEKVVSL